MKKIFAALTLVMSLFGFSALAQTPNEQAATEKNQSGTPASGVDITLEQESGAVVKTVRTDAHGKFEFSDLRPGIYRIKSGATVLSPRDQAAGQASGKQGQATATTSSVPSPRDVATGQSSGKRVATGENHDTSANAEGNRATINTSRSNIKNQRIAAEIIPDDEADPLTPAKAGVSTSRSNIRNKQSENLSETNKEVLAVQFLSEDAPTTKRTVVVPHILEKSGVAVQVGASGRIAGNILKTRHDTVKNSINNVR